MKPKIVISEEHNVYALCVLHIDGTVGWLLNEKADVKTYDSTEAAERDRKRILKDSRYSWTDPVEVREFRGFSKKG